MKKTLSSKSLSSLKFSSSLKKQKGNFDQKTIVKSSLKSMNEVLKSPENDQKDIKQIYEYKIKQRGSKNINKTKNDFKKQMLSKLMDRPRIKTQQDNNIQQIYNLNKSKSKNSKNSKNNVTMNLNVSFVKIKNSSEGQIYNSQLKHQSFKSKQKGQQRKLESSQEKFTNYSTKVQPDSQNNNLKAIFDYYALKNTINLKDLQNFLQLNLKVFSEYEKIIKYSSKIYQKILKNLQINSWIKQNNGGKLSKEMKEKVNKIQNLYSKMELLKYRESTLKTQFSQNQDQVKDQESLISSEVSSYKLNPQKYQSYRLKKLNQNLGLLSNLEQKKNKITAQAQNQPKMYLSKPVSSHASRKVSINNSFNNSLKNSKIQ